MNIKIHTSKVYFLGLCIQEEVRREREEVDGYLTGSAVVSPLISVIKKARWDLTKSLEN